MTSRTARVLAAALLAAALSVPSLALAATPPVYQVQAWFGGASENPDRVLLVASVLVPTSTPLPAKVRVPVPEGATVLWSGEILGATGESDIPREGTMTAGTGGRAYEFTLEQSREGQLECLWSNIEPRKGGAVGASLKWVQTVPADLVGFSVRTPAGAGTIRTDPQSNDAPNENADGERIYTLPNQGLAPGESAVVDVSYVPGGASDGIGGGALDTRTLIIGLAVAAVAVAAVLAVMIRREGMAAAAGGPADEPDDA
ncbi:MAG: hypothetical protein FDZ70_03790 [Actinobacteria bacterium]|nr:MAG: hypothetical protein FDZ70_03790 [Actinomycetota bacterium]